MAGITRVTRRMSATGGTLAMAEPAARGMLGKQRLDHLQACAKPMLVCPCRREIGATW
jgi:hypothetical protein